MASSDGTAPVAEPVVAEPVVAEPVAATAPSVADAEATATVRGRRLDADWWPSGCRCSTRRSISWMSRRLLSEWAVNDIVLRDMLELLARPGRDPREDLPAPVFRRGIVKLEDLEPGMQLSGTVLNVVDFGAFVDIGLTDSGLVHISRLADRFVRDPHEVVGVGDVLTVWVVEIDKTAPPRIPDGD